MIHLEIGGEKYPIAAAETVVGSASDSAVVLSGEGVRPRHAVIQGPSPVAIRSAEAEAEVKVNGVRLGTDPTPLLHGDKIEIGGHELLVVDTTRAGSTQLFDSGAFADLAPPPSPKSTGTRSGGRLVCLTDGREYTVGTNSLSLGRDAASDVVVSGSDVSRHHAEIRSDPNGYTLVDLSVNGTYVNGQRIGKTHLLTRADVIRIGNDEFRFYADAPSPSPQAPPAPAIDPGPAVGEEPTPPPTGAGQRLSDTMYDIPAVERQRVTPTSPEAAPLASLLFRTGDLKGRRLPIKVPVVNIGRGDYNDLIIADPSVSTMHAKLQRREAVWILTDLGSTNGTFVEGERLTGEAPLGPGTTLRFGDVTALFEPLDEKTPVARTHGTRLMERLDAKARAEEPVLSAQPARPRPRRPIRATPRRPAIPSPVMLVGLAVLLVILAYLVLS
ncbi:MAG TPA: FHA domain-containing protein [Gemmatimonadales bacterium]|nr:FHA domain-containing protein [Gemmatimonadales bacterium]